MSDIPGDISSTVRISVGETYRGVSEDGSDVDAIGIELVGGQSYRIEMNPGDATSGASFDPFIEGILNSNGHSLGQSDDDSGAGLGAVLIFTPTAPGTYFIQAGTLIVKPTAIGLKAASGAVANVTIGASLELSSVLLYQPLKPDVSHCSGVPLYSPVGSVLFMGSYAV